MKRSLFPLLMLLSGCSLVPDYKAPAVPTPPWHTEKTPIERISPDWWRGFENAELDTLLREALAANNDVQASIHRVAQARATAQIAGARLFPNVDATGNIGRDYSNLNRSSRDSSSSYRAGLQAGYELDLFGANRAGRYAALSAVEASEYSREALVLVVMSDTAQGFVTLLSLHDRINIAQNNLINALDVMKITQARFDAGVLSGIELSQQKTALANNEAAIATLEQQLEAARNQLAVLVAKPPQEFNVKSASLTSITLPEIAPIQPAQLLLHRPDIRVAESQLFAANYDIGAARAAFFPNFSLSASAVVGATPLSAPAALSSALAAAASAPLFQGGALTGRLALTKARRSELEEQYKKTVLVSFQEVQDALAAEASANERVKQFTLAVEQAQTTYGLVRQRFDAGTIDFLTLLDAQGGLFSAQDALIAARAAQYNAAIDLFKALGGGWKIDSNTE